MRFYIYGLIDPRNYKVRYVGLTRTRIDRRLEHHLNAAGRGNAKPVYAWIREISPLKPHVVCLEVCEGIVRKSGGSGWRNAAAPAEVKWIKRFRRDCLNAVAHESTKADWKRLVN